MSSPDAGTGRSGAGHTAEGRGLTRSAVTGLFWTFMGSGAQAVLQLLVLLILARLVTPAAFGVVSAAQVVVALTQIFSQLGVGPAVVQRLDLQPIHLRAGFTLSALFGAAMSVVVFAAAPLAAALFRMPSLEPVVRILSLLFMVQGVGVVAESLLQRDLDFRRLAIIDIGSLAIGYGAVGVTLAFLGFGVWALVAAQVTQVGIKAGWLLLARPHPHRPTLDRSAVGDLLYFGGGFTVARVGNYIASQADQFVVGRWLGAEALGIYGRAYQLMAAPAFLLGQMLDKVLFPSMARAQGEAQRLGLAYRRSVALIALVTLPASAVLLVLAPEVIAIVLGPGWSGAIVPFRIFALGMLFRSSYKMSDALARATGAVYRRAWRQSVYALLVAAGAWTGQRFGLAGVAAGVLIAITLNFFLMGHLSLSLTRLRWREFAAAHRQPIAVAAGLGVVIWCVATGLRALGAPIVMIVAAAIAVCAGVSLLVLRRAPGLFGPDGTWMLATLAPHLPPRLAVLLVAPVVVAAPAVGRHGGGS